MMKTSLALLKKIIGSLRRHENLYLSVIDEKGTIIGANAGMRKRLSGHSSESLNFLELIHPEHTEDFIKAIHLAGSGHTPSLELYFRNSTYHQMRWVIYHLEKETGKKYLCLGYNILDAERQYQFNRLVKDYYQLITESLSGIIFQDGRGEIIAVNKKTASLLDTSLEALYTLKDIASLWNNEWAIYNEQGDRSVFEQTPFMKALETGRIQKETLRVLLKNGETRWLLFTSQALPDEGSADRPLIITTMQDVTREHQLSRKLKEREAIIGAFLHAMPNLSWMVDEDTKLQFASDSFYKLFGGNEKSCVGCNISEVVPNVVTAAVYEKHLEVLETGQATTMTQKIKWADGSDFISYINIFPIPTTGEKRLLGGNAIFLPDKSRLENELRQTRERIIHLSRATSDAIWEWDMQNGHIFRNEALMAMIGYQPDNSKGLSWWLRRIHPEDRNRVADTVKEAAEEQHQSWQEEYRFKCADGSYKPVRDRGFVVYENGLPVKMIGSLQDISTLRELEGKLADERLQRQKKISETVIHVLEKERARIGHELHDNVNQLLSTSKLFIDVLEPKEDEQLKLKQKSIDYLLAAIEEIRHISKELVTPRLQEQDLAEAIRAMVSDINMAGTTRFNFSCQPETIPMSVGKKTTLFRIIQEQIKNIIKHGKATDATIELGIHDDDIRLIIRDNGQGFDPQQTYRGIGLANIYERSRFYNGHANIQSMPGKGCTLVVTIPMSD